MKIKVITPISNGIKYLPESLLSTNISNGSVIRILADCNSTDGLQRIINLTDEQNLLYLSEKDSGPAQAINNVLSEIDDGVIGWLNSDDCYHTNTIKKVLKCFNENPKYKIIYGLAKHIDSHGKIIDFYPTLPPDTPVNKFKNGNFICQPTVFYRKSVFEEVGFLDEGLKTAFDFDFFIRCFLKLKKSEIGFINQVIAFSRIHDDAITFRLREDVFLESMAVIYKYFQSVPMHWPITYINELYINYPFTRSNLPLLETIKIFLSKIKKYLSDQDFERLIVLLKNDKRLLLSNERLFIDVLEDGWVGKEFEVRLRYTAKQTRKIYIKANGGWPRMKKLTLTVYGSNGEIHTQFCDSKGPFTLTLEAPETNSESFFFWRIKTCSSFIPKANNKLSEDSRRLSFKILSASIN